MHTTALVGAARALAEAHAQGLLRGRVRLLFQPAEEVMPGGALDLMTAGALDGVERIFSLHCDPTVDVGQVGLREGPLTGAADRIEVRLTGAGGHTSRPHLTQDVIFALGKVITEVPAILSRRLDPRAGVSVVWGVVDARARRTTSSRARAWSAARSGCSTRSPGPRPRRWPARRSSRSSRRTA